MAAVEAAMSDAQIAAESIGYLEAHGTATLLGDPVEVASITEVYRRSLFRTADHRCVQPGLAVDAQRDRHAGTGDGRRCVGRHRLRG